MEVFSIMFNYLIPKKRARTRAKLEGETKSKLNTIINYSWYNRITRITMPQIIASLEGKNR